MMSNKTSMLMLLKTLSDEYKKYSDKRDGVFDENDRHFPGYAREELDRIDGQFEDDIKSIICNLSALVKELPE